MQTENNFQFCITHPAKKYYLYMCVCVYEYEYEYTIMYCYGLNVYVPSKFIFWNPNTQGGALINGISV